jgi:hypothetical protein
MSNSPLSWTVSLDLLSEGEVELRAFLNGEDRGPAAHRCSVQEALRELEVLFACTGDADFFLAIRGPNGPWCHLATRRWRLALLFITSHYERAFVQSKMEQQSEGGEAPRRLPLPSSELGQPAPAHHPSVVMESGPISVLPVQAQASTGTDAED